MHTSPALEGVHHTPPPFEPLLHSYWDLFDPPTRLPPTRPTNHRITLLLGTQLVNVRPYRYVHAHKTEIERQVKDMLAASVIRPSSSPFSSLALLVHKSDGTWRFCVDYRNLNQVTVKFPFPVPVIDELLDELRGAIIFSKLDLRSGFHQIRMHAPDIPKTAFRTHDDHFEFLVMPFGLYNAPSTFQALMNSVFKPFLRKFVLVFFDDILVFSSNLQTHLTYLALVFDVLRAHTLKLKASKCSFGQTTMAYLGHTISADGVAVDSQKVHCITESPHPRTVKGLRGFLGLAGYYRKFVRDFGVIAHPLIELLKKDNFKWSLAADLAFSALKQALASTPVLALPDFTMLFTIECDTSDIGIGAVLSQKSTSHCIPQ